VKQQHTFFHFLLLSQSLRRETWSAPSRVQTPVSSTEELASFATSLAATDGSEAPSDAALLEATARPTPAEELRELRERAKALVAEKAALSAQVAEARARAEALDIELLRAHEEATTLRAAADERVHVAQEEGRAAAERVRLEADTASKAMATELEKEVCSAMMMGS